MVSTIFAISLRIFPLNGVVLSDHLTIRRECTPRGTLRFQILKLGNIRKYVVSSILLWWTECPQSISFQNMIFYGEGNYIFHTIFRNFEISNFLKHSQWPWPWDGNNQDHKYRTGYYIVFHNNKTYWIYIPLYQIYTILNLKK